MTNKPFRWHDLGPPQKMYLPKIGKTLFSQFSTACRLGVDLKPGQRLQRPTVIKIYANYYTL